MMGIRRQGQILARLLAVGMTLNAAEAAAQQQAAPPSAVTGGGTTADMSTAAAEAEPTPAERVRSVVERHCESCHGGAAPAQAAPAITADADALLRRRSLVVPGRPDASRLYTIMLSGHLVADNAAVKAPSAEDIDRVRAWISAATPSSACRLQRPATLQQLGNMLQRLRDPGAESLKAIRFISLASYHNGCADTRTIGDAKVAVRHILSKLRTDASVTLELPYAADDLPVIAVRLTDLGWHAARWDALAAQADAPRLVDKDLAQAYDTTTPMIDAAALAAAIDDLAGMYFLSGTPTRHGPNASPVATPVDSAAADLLYDGRRPVSVLYAAAELGIQPADLLAMLQDVTGMQEASARSLRQGTIPRENWNALRAELTLPGTPGVLRYALGVHARPWQQVPEVLLWTDQSAYKRGALLVITAQPNFDCNLTIINVDPKGDATVLYPSDSDPGNAVKAGTKVRIPSDIEPYQLRAADVGTESFIAVCSANRQRMLGVDQDFERQRFSILGEWPQFLKTAATREQEIARRETPRPRRRRRAAAPTPPTPVVRGPEREARSAIYVQVE